MSLETFLDAVAGLEHRHVTIVRVQWRDPQVHISDPAERDGMLDLLEAHDLSAASGTRYHVNIADQAGTHVASISSVAPNTDLGVAIAESLLAWEADPDAADVPCPPGHQVTWPDVLSILHPGENADSTERIDAYEIGTVLISAVTTRAKNGPFGSALNPSGPTAALLGVLIAGSLPAVLPNTSRLGLDPKDAGTWAQLVAVAHAETRLAARERDARQSQQPGIRN